MMNWRLATLVMHIFGPVIAVAIMWFIASSAHAAGVGTECQSHLIADGEDGMEFFITDDGRRDATLVSYVPYYRDGKVDGSYTIEYQCSKRSGTYYYSWRTKWPDYISMWSSWYPIGGRVPNDAVKELPER